jgi:hypothetical protein
LLAIGTYYLAMGWTNGIRILGSMHDFTATRDYLWFSWWPWLFVVVFIGLAVVSIFSHIPERMLYHTTIILLVIEAIILFAAQLFLLLPLIGTDYSR